MIGKVWTESTWLRLASSCEHNNERSDSMKGGEFLD